MRNKIHTHDQLQKVLQAMAGEVVDAYTHFTLLMDLGKMQRRYWREFSQSQAFWSLTIRAHIDAVLIRLCKAYSQDEKSANLRTLLETVRANPAFFDADRFRERLAANPHVESLARTPRRPDPAQLRRDLKSVVDGPRVKHLMMWRHKYYAHRDPSKILKGVVLSRDYPLVFKDIQWLLDNALRIINHYSGLYLATVNSRRIIGYDDYKYILNALRESLRTSDRRLREQTKLFRRTDASRSRQRTPAGETGGAPQAQSITT